MAPSVPNVKTVARTAVKSAARAAPLLREVETAGPERDEWAFQAAPPSALSVSPPVIRLAVRRGQNLTRRAVGLGVLFVLTLLGAGVVAVALLLLGVALASGSDVAGGLMVFTLMLAFGGAFVAARRARALLRPSLPEAAAPPVSADAAPDAESVLLGTLRAHEHHLPPQARAAFHTTVIATRDALRATAADVQMNRDAFDARQAAREDLPELLDAYRAVPRDPRNDAQLLEQLRLIHTRMADIVEARAAHTQDQFAAHGRYLREKYQGEPEN